MPSASSRRTSALAILLYGLIQRCQVVEALGDVGMAVTVRCTPDVQCVLKHRLSGLIVAGELVEQCQVIETLGHIRMLRSQGSSSYVQCLMQQWLSRRVGSHSFVHQRQIIERLGNVRMVVAKCSALNT